MFGTVKENIVGDATFVMYRDYCLWYKIETTGSIIPVPTSDIGTTTFNATEKAIWLMRWIRKYHAECNKVLQ